MKKTKATNNRKGFTIVETLAVLIIIGLLAAVTIPKYINLKAKNKAMLEVTDNIPANGYLELNDLYHIKGKIFSKIINHKREVYLIKVSFPNWEKRAYFIPKEAMDYILKHGVQNLPLKELEE